MYINMLIRTGSGQAEQSRAGPGRGKRGEDLSAGKKNATHKNLENLCFTIIKPWFLLSKFLSPA